MNNDNVEFLITKSSYLAHEMKNLLSICRLYSEIIEKQMGKVNFEDEKTEISVSKVDISNAEELENTKDPDLDEVFAGCKGILVPGGFGDRGVEGKIMSIQYAREKKIPFLGLCLGMQCAVIEFARHVCGMTDAHSSEFCQESTHPVIDLMESQLDVEDKGGTMRLGAYPCKIQPGTKTEAAYGTLEISERHRHR